MPTPKNYKSCAPPEFHILFMEKASAADILWVTKMELKQTEVFVNSFTPSSNETEQLEVEREDRQTVLRNPLPSQPKANVDLAHEDQQTVLQDPQPVLSKTTIEFEHDEDRQTVLRDPLPVSEPKTASGDEASVERKPTIEFASAPSISSGLTFSCVLIPRFDDHYLAGDITVDLLTWMKEVCISYGWHLDAITIRPGYMHWVMTVPLTANPSQFIRVTRLQISQKIFENYPRFKRKNLSSDFWAPSFSVAAGSQPHSMEDVDNFIRQTRSQQGIY